MKFELGQLSARPNVKEPSRSLGEAVRRSQANMSLEMETVDAAASPDELSSGGTWFIRRKGRFTAEHGDASAVREPTGSGTRPNPRLGKKLAARSVEKQYAEVPEGAEKIIIRPKGGINRILEEVGRLRMHVYLAQAAGVDPEAADEDVASPNLTQQSIMIATLDAARASKYAAITALRVGRSMVETKAYIAMPENGGKGVIHDVPLDATHEEILDALRRNKKNPSIIGVRRLGAKSKSVLLLFEDWKVPMEVYLRCFPTRCYLYKKKYEVCVTCGKLGHRADVCPNPDDVRCRGCGAANPESNHSCEPRCLLCKKAHLLGDNKCREIYRMPYIIKKRLWEKKMEQEKLQAQAPTQGEPQASKSAPIEENRGRARDATSDQAGQQSRERSSSRPGRRSSSWSGGGRQQNPAKGPADQGRGPANQGQGPGLPPRDPKDPWGKKKKEENIHSVSFGSKGSQAEKDEISLLKKEIEEQKKANMRLERLLRETQNHLIALKTDKGPAEAPKKCNTQITPPASVPASSGPEEEVMNVDFTRQPPSKRKAGETDPLASWQKKIETWLTKMDKENETMKTGQLQNGGAIALLQAQVNQQSCKIDALSASMDTLGTTIARLCEKIGAIEAILNRNG